MEHNYNFDSVEIVNHSAAAAFSVSSQSVFKEDEDIIPRCIGQYEYMPWGEDNEMPYNILELIEKDETLSTCQIFNAEVCYGSGLHYNTDGCSNAVRESVEEFLLCNSLPEYFLGVCQDFKHFGFCVSVIILNNEETPRVVRLIRKEACYCRLSPANKRGVSERLFYANWRKTSLQEKDIEVLDLLDVHCPWNDLAIRLGLMPGADGKKWVRTNKRKFAILTKVPTPDNTYYPIPYYASLFRGNWYNIKQLIGMAKEAKLKNSAPIKYHIEVSESYWKGIFQREGIADSKKRMERVVEEKQKIIDFLTGVENSGKAWFSTVYVNPRGEEIHEVTINKIEDSKEGGDWASDIIEAVNMFCFTMRVHSNLVGSVPGKTQTNNSGSDKRELYTIAQALQKPYHDLMFLVHRIIIRMNNWEQVKVECPFMQLTTLDEHTDAREVITEEN